METVQTVAVGHKRLVMYECLPAHRSQLRGSGLLRSLNAHSAPDWPHIGSQDKPIASAKKTRGSQTIWKKSHLADKTRQTQFKSREAEAQRQHPFPVATTRWKSLENVSVRNLKVLALLFLRQALQPAQPSTSATCARLLHGSATPHLRSDDSQTKTREGGSSSSRLPFENNAHTTTSRLSPSLLTREPHRRNQIPRARTDLAHLDTQQCLEARGATRTTDDDSQIRTPNPSILLPASLG